MAIAQSQGFQGYGVNAASAGLSPQGLDVGSIVSTVAQHALQILPPLILGLLSSHPQLQQVAGQGGTSGIAPQSFNLSLPFFNLGVSDSKPLLGANGAGLAPQGIDFGAIAGTLAKQVLPMLPGLIGGLLSAHPQVQALTSQGGSSAVAPQFSFATPFFSLNTADSKPLLGVNGAGVAPQGIDFGSILSTVVSGAVQVLPTLVTSLLSAQPQVQQLSAQGIDFGAIARTVGTTVAPHVLTIAQGLLSQYLNGRTSA